MSVLLVDLCSGSRFDWEQTLLLADALQHHAHRASGEAILLACPRGSVLAAEAKNLDLPLAELPTAKAGFSLWRALGGLIRARGVSVLHSMDACSLTICSCLRRRFPSLRFIHTMRHPVDPKSSSQRWKIRQTDRLVFPSSGLREHSASTAPDRVRVILPAWRPVSPRGDRPERPRAAGARFIFVAVGPLLPGTDTLILLRAMAYLQDMDMNLPPWEVRVVSHGPLSAELLDIAASLKVLDRLVLLGAQDFHLIMPDGDAVVCPDTQGAGAVFAVLTAWAYGIPVACSAVPAYCEIGEDKKSLLLSPPANPAAFAGAMLRLMQEPDTRGRLRQGGEEALRSFRPERMAGEYALLYREVREQAL
jgi:glycosyltransferase involved in cell wall biosynthesis